MVDDRRQISQHVGGREPQHANTLPLNPFVAPGISLGRVAAFVRHAVYFDRQPTLRAEEVENERACRVLLAELEACRALSKCLP